VNLILIKYLYFIFLLIILVCGIILLILSLSGRVKLSQQKNDEELDNWHPWQFLGLTFLIKDTATCIALVIITIAVIITFAYILGIEPIF